jgi:putative tryptophan/tyrosine transport system substrate-binding protein
MTGADPVEFGFETSFNRPAGNLTGVAYQSAEVTAKRFTLLQESVPTAETIAFLAVEYGSFNQAQTRDWKMGTARLGLTYWSFALQLRAKSRRCFRPLSRARRANRRPGVNFPPNHSREIHCGISKSCLLA